jgi:hypothetical protein
LKRYYLFFPPPDALDAPALGSALFCAPPLLGAPAFLTLAPALAPSVRAPWRALEFRIISERDIFCVAGVLDESDRACFSPEIPWELDLTFESEEPERAERTGEPELRRSVRTPVDLELALEFPDADDLFPRPFSCFNGLLAAFKEDASGEGFDRFGPGPAVFSGEDICNP